MTDANVINAAENLRTRTPERIWGLSPESIYTALAAKSAGNPVDKRLSPHVRAEMLRTNDERDPDYVTTLHNWVLDKLGLISRGELSLLGFLVVTSETPKPLIRAIAVARLQKAETILRSCREIKESLPRREFDSLLANDWDETVLGSLMGSLGFVTIYPDSVEPDFDRIDSALATQSETSIQQAVTEAHFLVLPHLVDIENEQCIKDLVEQVTEDRPTNESSPTGVAAALARSRPATIDSDEVEEAVVEQREQYEEQFDVLRSLLAPTVERDITRVETGSTIDTGVLPDSDQVTYEERQLLIDIVATVMAHPEFASFDAGFVTDRLDASPYTVYQLLSSIPGVACEVTEDGVFRFDSLPESIEGENLREEYTTHLVNRCSKVQHWVDALSDVSVSMPPKAMAAEGMIAEDYESLSEGNVAPAYFTYTLIDPEALGEEKMNNYVGDSRGLGREQARLRRWHANRPSGLRSYTAMTDQLFSLGLERELDDRVLRIMTPFDDDTFNEYVAQIRRLLERGFELRLLTRHTKEPWEWRRLQRHFLSEIKEHRDQITVRTYSRFKEHQRVTSDMDFRDLGELGIHGKVQTIGNPEEGAALLGSANFMENSYDWNPECGVYTERTQFVDAATEFFDIVWDISEADELSVERLQEISDCQLVPTYYN